MRQVGFVVMLLTVFVATSAFSALIDDNVVLYLPFDEGSGKVAKDHSKFKNDGAIHNTKWVNGKYEDGVEFNGKDAEVRVKDDRKSFSLKQVTLEVWYNPGTEGTGAGWRVVINKAWNEWYLYVKDSQPMFFINSDVNNATSPDKIPENKWIHLAGTYDGKEIKMYADGELKATKKYSGTILDRDCTLQIGSRHPNAVNDKGCAGNNLYWSSAGVRMDEVRVSNVARTQKEIQRSMEGGATAVDPSGKMATTWSQVRTRYFR